MFNPFPYKDPNAVNYISNDGSVDLSKTAEGSAQIAAVLAGAIKDRKVIAIDGYATAPFGKIVSLIGADAEYIDVASIYKTSAELNELFAENLPTDREKDPVLLYGKLFDKGYRGIFDDKKLSLLKEKLSAKEKTIVLYGNGALSEELYGLSVRTKLFLSRLRCAAAIMSTLRWLFRSDASCWQTVCSITISAQTM